MRAVIQCLPLEGRDVIPRLLGDFAVTHQPSWANNHILVATTPEDKLLMYVAKRNLSLSAPSQALFKLRSSRGDLTLAVTHTVTMVTLHIHKD